MNNTPSITMSYDITARNNALDAMCEISLNGYSTLTISQGTTYAPCLGAMTQNCELGATATLVTPGDSTPSIIVVSSLSS